MRIHLIAIGGSIMHNLAIDLHIRGHVVSGSDDEIYNPAREQLKKHGLLPEEGWHVDRITTDLNLIILGMHAKRDNPELIAALDQGLKIVSFPEFVGMEAFAKKRIVIAGSHGKTTTTSLIMHVWRRAGISFDYLVGARLPDFDRMVKLSAAPVILLEGDEYLSSCLDKRPKFLHYDPDILIITGIAWDHMNVFPTREIYIEEFRKLITGLREDCVLVYHAGDEVLTKLVSTHCNARMVISYNGFEFETDRDQFNVVYEGRKYPVQLFGSHNMQNAHAAFLVCVMFGIEVDDYFSFLSTFTGASKRLQRINVRDRLVFLDFAHAPSKVEATCNAVSERYPGRRLLAFFELHTYSSLNPGFIREYGSSMHAADTAVIYYSSHTLKMKGMAPMDDEVIRGAINHSDLVILRNAEDLNKYIGGLREDDSIWLFMTSGTFDGLELLTEGG